MNKHSGVGFFTAVLLVMASAGPARAEPAACLSPDPSQWPPSSKPYFMIVADTSGSMTTTVGNPAIASLCGYGTDRVAHLRCALRNTIQAYAGQVNMGLATFPRNQTGCGAICYSTCAYSSFPGDVGLSGCGAGTGATRRGASIRVPMQQDSFWQAPPPASNVPALLNWVDNNCNGNIELFANGLTPLNGMMLDLRRYFGSGWTAPDNSVTYGTPLSAQDLAGTGVNGGTACRPVNIILIVDGGDGCDAVGQAAVVAADLYNNGVTVGGKTFKVRTHVINLAIGFMPELDNIAASGGTTASHVVANETDISQALNSIISSTLSPERCDNVDNNCNGCTDEGYTHYANIQAGSCCTWKTPAQRVACGATACACCNATNTVERATCIANFRVSITPAAPGGDRSLLPCVTAAAASSPSDWLCDDPGDRCDNQDNNGVGGVDENATRCGVPLHCPQAEQCNGVDDDCDGVVDPPGTCPNGCIWSPEVCDGCDNDCDGVVDNSVAPVACGSTTPANCVGMLTCSGGASVPVGGCMGGGGVKTCTNNPQAEVCDAVDNNCNGLVDDDVISVACVPAGTPSSLVYGGSSACRRGQTLCTNGVSQCVGFVGPSAEVCDGVDNNCDGVVDNGVPGVGQTCGLNQAPCVAGVTACVNGALVCNGGVRPHPERCDGVDNDCDGAVDNGVLADAPAPGMNGCWALPGNCCAFPTVSPSLFWCPPPGAGCNGEGALAPPCHKGTLTCAAGGWQCVGAQAPSAEVCDGLDNNCNGTPDDGALPGVGAACGNATLPCTPGTTSCAGGRLACVGGVRPSPESCDGVDNDCDGTTDNLPPGVPVACTPPYDAVGFPGPRSAGACHGGHQQCGGASGQVCVGGVAPQPEVCDGLDNDCDGQVDEAGAAPDGINGTVDVVNPALVLGAACGNACGAGTVVCVNGHAACNAPAATTERCDGADNDCDGVVDNANAGDFPPLCNAGDDCVHTNRGARCSQPCDPAAQHPCPTGEMCEPANRPDGTNAGNHCLGGTVMAFAKPPPKPPALPELVPGRCSCASPLGNAPSLGVAALLLLGLWLGARREGRAS